MRISLVVPALLCFTTWMSMVHATHGPMSTCCIQWSNTRVPINRIINYTIQSEGACPIKAIIFQTNRRKRLCSDPNDPWTNRAIQKVDEEKAALEKGQTEDGSTGDITPAASVTSKKGLRKTGRNQRRGLRRRKSRKGRKGQRKRV